MRIRFLFYFVFTALPAFAQGKQAIHNPMIDYSAFLAGATNVAALREQRCITEERFILMAAEPGTVVLDARSPEKYRMLHVKGAKHLSLADMTAAELARIIPAKNTRVLIYCNNNFQNEQAAFPAKAVAAPLNIYTFNALHSYGYTNVYELGPLIDITRARLPFAGTRVNAE